MRLHKSAEIRDSKLADYCVVRDGTNIFQSELGQKVQLERYNSILFSNLGKYCYTGHTTTIINANLGNFNSISWNVSIGGNTHDMNKVTTHSFLVYPKWDMGGNANWQSAYQECRVDNDVWIAAGVNILRGVHIGNGAVIGARAVVTKDVEPYSIMVGNPARVIRMRCSDEIKSELLDIKWWDFPVEVIKSNYDTFNSELTMDIVHKLRDIKASIEN